MKKHTSLFIVLAWLFLSWGAAVQAAGFSQAYVRLDRLQNSQQTTTLICVKPTTNAIESQVEVQFPISFAVSSSIANWATSTSELPQGAAAWPGIGAAQSVSGTSVIFPSANLTVAQLYCFRTSNQASLKTPMTVGTYDGLIQTKTSASTIIDATKYALTTTASDQMSVSANVSGSANNLVAFLTRNNAKERYRQEETLLHTFSYGHSYPASSVIELEAEWSKGTIDGDSTPTINVLSYVSGSATNAYGGVVPVIDVQQRTIRWIIPAVPTGYNGTVQFALRTTSSIADNKKVNFHVKARAIGLGTQSPDSTITNSYKFKEIVQQSSVVPTAPLTDVPTQVPITIAPSEVQKLIKNVSITSVASRSATVTIETTLPTILKLDYATNPDVEDARFVNQQTYTYFHRVQLKELRPYTEYYFSFVSRAQSGQRVESDVYLLKTAKTGTSATINEQSIILTSSNIMLHNASVESEEDSKDGIGDESNLAAPKQAEDHVVVIPEKKPLELYFKAQKGAKIVRATLFFRLKNVLGASTFVNSEGVIEQNVDIVENASGEFVGRFSTNYAPGLYELFVRVFDDRGNVTEQQLLNLKISPQMRLVQKGGNVGIEQGRVFLSSYDVGTRIYNPIATTAYEFGNPIYSDFEGIVDIALPSGKYLANISATGYKSRDLYFEIGSSENQNYPTIELNKEPFNIITSVIKRTSILEKLASSIVIFSQNELHSNKLYELNAIMIVIMFVVVTWFAFSARIRIPWHSLYQHVGHRMLTSGGNKSDRAPLIGHVINAHANTPVSGADIFLIDKKTTKIIDHTVSKKDGAFAFTYNRNRDYIVEVAALGFEPIGYVLSVLLEAGVGDIRLSVMQNAKHVMMKSRIKTAVVGVVGLSFEAFLLVSIIGELLLGLAFGWVGIAPLLAISVLNLLLWVHHLSYKNHMRQLC